MNLRWFGDSYDIVKRFFVHIAKRSGYSVYLDPMFTDGQNEQARQAFYEFIGAVPYEQRKQAERAALLLDPDTGIGVRSSSRHVSVASVAARTEEFELVLVFDQAFSRSVPVATELQRKLNELRSFDVSAFYYDSHARFLFCSRSLTALESFARSIRATGLPDRRLVWQTKPAA